MRSSIKQLRTNVQVEHLITLVYTSSLAMPMSVVTRRCVCSTLGSASDPPHTSHGTARAAFSARPMHPAPQRARSTKPAPANSKQPHWLHRVALEMCGHPSVWRPSIRLLTSTVAYVQLEVGRRRCSDANRLPVTTAVLRPRRKVDADGRAGTRSWVSLAASGDLPDVAGSVF